MEWNLRLLKGEELSSQEIPCKIEYRTNNGTASVFAAAQAAESAEKLQFLEQEDGSWSCVVYHAQEQQESICSQQQAQQLFLNAGIDIDALKADSVRVQRQIMQEKEEEKQAQTRKEDDVIW